VVLTFDTDIQIFYVHKIMRKNGNTMGHHIGLRSSKKGSIIEYSHTAWKMKLVK
jgi:hypothetical protein